MLVVSKQNISTDFSLLVCVVILNKYLRAQSENVHTFKLQRKKIGLTIAMKDGNRYLHYLSII